jgi:hypothetical protein
MHWRWRLKAQQMVADTIRTVFNESDAESGRSTWIAKLLDEADTKCLSPPLSTKSIGTGYRASIRNSV